MSITPGTPNFTGVTKQFWDRAEGKFGKAVLIGVGLCLAGAVVFFWGLILPFLIGVVGNTIQLAGLIAVLTVLTSPLWSTKVRLFVSNAFQLSMRWTYQTLIASDPIGMLRNNVDTLRKQGAEFDKAVAQLAGSKQRLESDIQNQIQSIQHDKALSDSTDQKIAQLTAKVATLSGNDRQEVLLNIERLKLGKQGYLQTAGIANQTITAEKPILDQTNRMYDQLCRLRDLAQFKVQSLSQQADMYAKQRATILASQKALGAAGRIIKGDPQQLAIVDQTIEYLNNEAADTIGAMNDFNRWSEKYLTDMDVQNGANADEATKIFGALEQKLNLPSAVTGVSLVGVTPDDSVSVSPGKSSTDDYLNLLK
jgi:hypothetical protein